MAEAPIVSYLGSTRHSIKISWTSCKTSHELSYIVQIEDRVYDWITKYWGLETSTEIKNLGPEEIFNIRVGCVKKINDEWDDEVVWSDIFISATKFDLPWSFYLFQDIERSSVENIINFIQKRNWALGVLNRQGETALMKAIRLKNEPAVKLLVNGGADIDEQPWPSFRSPLMIACNNGNLTAAQIICAKGANWALKDVNGMEALHYAVEGSHVELVKFAIESGATVDAKDNFGWTSLMRGIIMGADSETLSLLIENGADPKSEDNWKRSCLKMATIVPLDEDQRKLFAADEDERKDEGFPGADGEKSDDESEMDLLAEHADTLKWILEENREHEENQNKETVEITEDKNDQEDNLDSQKAL